MAKPNARKNGAQPPTKPTVSDALKKAIQSLSTELLRTELESICHEFPAVIHMLNDRLLVQGKDVVRYHANTDSEDDADREIESEESESENDATDNSDAERGSKWRKSITIGNEEYTARMAICSNCNQEFNITLNDRGDCLWHTGSKTVDFESDFWADHDEDCHGPHDAFEDDPDYAEGFIWDCCDKPGDDEGCKSTKHKANVNLVVPGPPPVLSPNKKRKAEAELQMARVKMGRY